MSHEVVASVNTSLNQIQVNLVHQSQSIRQRLEAELTLRIKHASLDATDINQNLLPRAPTLLLDTPKFAIRFVIQLVLADRFPL